MILQKIFEPIVCFSATKLPGGVYFNHESPLKKGQKNNLKLNVIDNFVVKFYEKIPTKGQMILKCLFGVFNFFQKTNKNTSHSSKNEFICLFFGRIHGLPICFRNYLTFSLAAVYVYYGWYIISCCCRNNSVTLDYLLSLKSYLSTHKNLHINRYIRISNCFVF